MLKDKKIKVSRDYTYIGFFPTLRCNLRCPYCLNSHGEGLNRKRLELSANKLLDIFNHFEIEDNQLPITIQGGEPTQYKGLYDLINGLRKDIPIDLLTNLQFDVDNFINTLNPKRFNERGDVQRYPIRISFHPSNMGIERTIKDAKKLQNAGFKIALTSIVNNDFTAAIKKIESRAKEEGIFFYKKPFMGNVGFDELEYLHGELGLNGLDKDCLCKTEELIISSDLSVYRCNRDLYLEVNPVLNLQEPVSELNSKYLFCNHFGNCNPCDLVLKNGNSAVKIISLEEKCKK